MESDATPYLTCSEASKLLPGRPSTTAIWRWARRGVQSRGGERIRLQHVRMGGTLYTTAKWLDEFGRALAEADTRHFDESTGDPTSRSGPSADSRSENRHVHDLDRIERELDRSGIR